MRQYALDHGKDGIRANAVNADRVRTGLLTDEMVTEKNARAEELLRDPQLLARVKAEAAAKISKIPPRAKGVVGVTSLKA